MIISRIARTKRIERTAITERRISRLSAIRIRVARRSSSMLHRTRIPSVTDAPRNSVMK